MNHGYSRLGLALALSSGLLFTACGDDNNDSPSAPSSPAPVVPSPAPAPSAAPTPAPSPDTRPNPGEAVDFRGRMQQNAPPVLKIGGQAVMVDDQTTYDRAGAPIALADIQIGEVVRVRGIVMDDRTTTLATRITIPPPGDNGGQ